MERRIYEAAVEGSVISLLNLLQEDPHILDRVIISCYAETPLHIACMLGHAEFVQEILNRKPELAGELDSRKSSPLHLAAAKGYLNIVKNLVSVNSNMCFVLDRDGKNPLHIAAIKGHVDVLREMVQARPDAARVRMDRGETILHVCVRYNQLEAMRYLVETIKDQEFLNSKDDEGNTVLHLAVAEKQVDAIKFLITSTAVEVNALNANGCTALDICILTCNRRDAGDWEIRELLRGVGATNNIVKELHSTAQEFGTKQTEISASSVPKDNGSTNFLNNRETWLKKMPGSLMVVASLIATVTFQNGLNPLGGRWQEFPPGKQVGAQTASLASSESEVRHIPGFSILADMELGLYDLFMGLNTTGFVASLSIILLLTSGLPFIGHKIVLWILTVITWVAITALALTYLIPSTQLSVSFNDYYTGLIVQYVWFGFVGILLLMHIIRLLTRSITYWRRRREASTSNGHKSNDNLSHEA